MKTDEAVAGLTLRLEKLGKAQKAPFWAAVARHLSKSHRSMAEVDVVKLAAITPASTIALVPGKVIGAGKVERAVSVAALNFSAGARAAIARAGGKCLTIDELAKQNAKGTGIALIV